MTNKYIYRPATWDDFDQAYELYGMEHIESYGNFGVSTDEFRAEWEFPNFDLSQHSLYAFTKDGENVAFAELRYWREIPIRPFLFGYVHPDYREQGIGTNLLEWGLKQAEIFFPLVPDDARVVLGGFTNLETGKQLFEDNEFTCARQSHLMAIELDVNMPEPLLS